MEENIKFSNTAIISSSCNEKEFKYNEKIKSQNNNIYLSFGVHPQLLTCCAVTTLREQILFLDKLASEKRISAIGECGFDLYDAQYKATEKWQDEIFAEHLEIAIKYDLPVVLHVRRAMHKIFNYSKELKKCKSVIFHSWPGTFEEGQSLLNRGINAYFSFGNTILNGHKQQVRSCVLLPIDRILTETDAPYQPQKCEKYSSWKNIPIIIEKIANLRNAFVQEIEPQIEKNFHATAL